MHMLCCFASLQTFASFIICKEKNALQWDKAYFKDSGGPARFDFAALQELHISIHVHTHTWYIKFFFELF